MILLWKHKAPVVDDTNAASDLKLTHIWVPFAVSLVRLFVNLSLALEDIHSNLVFTRHWFDCEWLRTGTTGHGSNCQRENILPQVWSGIVTHSVWSKATIGATH